MLTIHAPTPGRRPRVFKIAVALVITTCAIASTAHAGGGAPEPATTDWGWIAALIPLGVMVFLLFYVLKKRSSALPPSMRTTSVRSSTARGTQQDKVSSDVVPRETSASKVSSAAGIAIPSSNSPHQEGRIFVSYRREDSGDVAGRIYDRLVERFGKQQVFKDVDSIPLGVDFRKHLQQMVGSCDVLLAVIGDDWLRTSGSGAAKRLDDAKDFVRIELEAALQRDIPVIPVLVRGADVPKESDLPPTLGGIAYRNGIAVRPDPDFHRDMDRLIDGVERHLMTKT